MPSAGFIWARLEPHQPTSGITRSTGDSLESFTVAKSRALRSSLAGARKNIEGAWSKANGKWSSQIFPGREFDNLDEFRAAKKQRAEQRIAYSDQNIGYRGSSSGKWSSLRHML